MNALQLLPGIRQLRTPLLTGYVWLVAGTILFGGRIPSDDDATGVWASIYGILGVFGPAAIALAISFTAYIVGSITERMGQGLYLVAHLFAVSMDRNRGSDEAPSLSRRWSERGFVVSPAGRDALERLILDRLSGHERRLRAKGLINQPEDFHVNTLNLYDLLVRELNLVATRLIVDEPALFSEVDRLRAEGELRHAISPALFVLVIVLSIEASPFWLLFLPGLFLFFRSGARSLLEAGDVLADALSIGKVDAPVFERLDTLVSQAIAENETFTTDDFEAYIYSRTREPEGSP